MLAVIVATGLGIMYADDIPWLKARKPMLRDIHTVDMYLIIAFFGVHVVGVVAAELTKRRRVTSDMMPGGATTEGEG